jgi:Zn-finger nucleic acid-binding protein
MKCPVDETVLQMTERRGVEIDYCPQCRGVWLDRGELDKIIEADLATGASVPESTRGSGSDYYREEYRDDRSFEQGGGRRPKKKNLLGELFDF